MSVTTRAAPPHFRDALAVAELFVGVFRRDLLAFYPQSRFEPIEVRSNSYNLRSGPDFQLIEEDEDGADALQVSIFGNRHRLAPRDEGRFTAHDRRMIRALGAVATLRYHHLFQMSEATRLELFRGGSEDHYVAAFVEPQVYALSGGGRSSRIAATILTLRTAALSTYENRRVATGALLLGLGDDPEPPRRVTAPDALSYGTELTSLKSIHRLCDGTRTLYLVDRAGKLADIIDIERWAARVPGPAVADVPCAHAYAAHARATGGGGGHVCVVLSPNQEIKLFAGGAQAFAYAHGRWRMLDPVSKFAVWEAATGHPDLARTLFQSALDLAESRHGGLFVVVADPDAAIGRLVAPHDVLTPWVPSDPPAELSPGNPLAKRALHYLARGRDVLALDPSVLEALSGLDGALVTDRGGRLLAFGAILRHDASSIPGPITAEGARTTAALVASRYGPVLKVSEDGIVSCFLDGVRVWDL